MNKNSIKFVGYFLLNMFMGLVFKNVSRFEGVLWWRGGIMELRRWYNGTLKFLKKFPSVTGGGVLGPGVCKLGLGVSFWGTRL